MKKFKKSLMKTRRKYYLKNRIFIWLLNAILVQSVVFGIALALMGVFSQAANEPYEVMLSNLEEKNSLLSDNMNNVLLEGNNLKQQLAAAGKEEEEQERLMDTLSRMSYLSEILCLDLSTMRGIGYRDAEPNVYSPKGSDIFCILGQSRTETAVALAGDWKYGLSEEDKEKMSRFMSSTTFQDEWFCEDGAIYYTMFLKEREQLVIMVMNKRLVEEFLTARKAVYDGMQAVLLGGNELIAGFDGSESRVLSEEDDKILEVESGKERYVGVKGQLQSYGRLTTGRHWYIGMVCKASAMDQSLHRLVLSVFGVYLLSILIAIFFSYYAIRFVMKPLNQLHCDITGQNAEKVHFEESSILEIDHIYTALNGLARELEECYSRYTFAMEAAEETIGSFEYKSVEKKTYLTGSLIRLMDIPEQWCEDGKVISNERFRKVWDGMRRSEEMDGYIFTDKAGEERCISIKIKEEENGIFGVVIDKTADYRQIRRLRFLSEHDQLTSLYNAGYMKEEGAVLLRENKDKVNAAVFCDLDNLKYVNDHFGHNIGDRYIVGMADALRRLERDGGCLCARMSGDEFAVLFYGYDSREEVRELVEKEYRRDHYIEVPGEGKFMIKASVGLAFAGEGEGIEALLKHADQAMYTVKHSTKNAVAEYKNENYDEIC